MKKTNKEKKTGAVLSLRHISELIGYGEITVGEKFPMGCIAVAHYGHNSWTRGTWGDSRAPSPVVCPNAAGWTGRYFVTCAYLLRLDGGSLLGKSLAMLF